MAAISYQPWSALAKPPSPSDADLMRSTLVLLALVVGTTAARSDEPSAGEAALRQCKICHSLAEGGPAKVGPNLHKIIGRKAGTIPGFAFSDAIKGSGIVWDENSLAAFLRDPKAVLPGNRMSFPGIKDDAVLTDLLARLKQATQ